MTALNPATLYVGARPPRHFRFAGEIDNVVVFESLLAQGFIQEINSEYNDIVNPVGTCVSYLQQDTTCPAPTVSTSLLCSSVYDQ